MDQLHKPFEFVESKNGSFGYIHEVITIQGIVKYSVKWIKNIDNERSAWWYNQELNPIDKQYYFRTLLKYVNEL